MVPCSHFQWFPHSSVMWPGLSWPNAVWNPEFAGGFRTCDLCHWKRQQVQTGCWFESFPAQIGDFVWANYSDLTVTSLESWLGETIPNMGLISVKYYNLPHPDLWTDVTKYWAMRKDVATWTSSCENTKKDQTIYGSIGTPCNPHETHTEHQEWGLETDFPQRERFLCSMWVFRGVFHQEKIGTWPSNIPGSYSDTIAITDM